MQGHTDGIITIILAKDEKTLYSCSHDKTIRSWDVTTGRQIVSYVGHKDFVTSVILSKDNKTLYSCGTDKTIRAWDVDTGK